MFRIIYLREIGLRVLSSANLKLGLLGRHQCALLQQVAEILSNADNFRCFLGSTMLKSLKRLNPLPPVIRALLYSSATGCLFCAPNVLAQAPPVVVDAQQTIGFGVLEPALRGGRQKRGRFM